MGGFKFGELSRCEIEPASAAVSISVPASPAAGVTRASVPTTPAAGVIHAKSVPTTPAPRAIHAKSVPATPAAGVIRTNPCRPLPTRWRLTPLTRRATRHVQIIPFESIRLIHCYVGKIASKSPTWFNTDVCLRHHHRASSCSECVESGRQPGRENTSLEPTG